MSTRSSKANSTAGDRGLAGALKGGMQVGLGVTQKMHQFAVEIPLSMVPSFVASDEQTAALKEKHSNLLNGMYGTIGMLGSALVDGTAEKVADLADGIGEVVYEAQAKQPEKKTRVVKAESKAKAAEAETDA